MPTLLATVGKTPVIAATQVVAAALLGSTVPPRKETK